MAIKPLISIIIPVYNKSKYLNTILDQLIQQTMSDFECLLINDGSTDSSGKICDEYSTKDNRLQVFHIPNSGVSHARNIGLDNAAGTYITFIDADDEIAPNYLENLYNCIVHSGADIVIGSSKKFWDNSDRTEMIQTPYCGLKTVKEVFPEFARNQYINGIYGFCWGKLLPRDTIGNTRFHEEIRLAEDLDFYLSIYPRISTIWFDNQPNYYYRQEAEYSSMLAPDWKINYYIQLTIQHKIHTTLDQMGYLFDENRRLTIDRIYDYVFFALFHSHKQDTTPLCRKIRSLNLPAPYSIQHRPWQHKWILLLYANKMDRLLTFTIRMYHLLRSLKR